MIRIRTPSRLHFGFFSLPCGARFQSCGTGNAASWLNHEIQATLPKRNFGGVGLMIDRPGIELTVEFANTWAAQGPLAERALHFAQTYCAAIGIKEPFQLRIESASPEHTGLGTGTQLGLAVARGIAELTGLPARDAQTLARGVGRGRRSAIGVHGFDLGGFLMEGGKLSASTISPMLVRRDFPEDWQILLITPRDLSGMHGRREVDAFGDLAVRERDDRCTETLSRLALLGMLPALIELELNAFGEALYDFNRRVGEMFQPAQGGIYAHPRVEEVVKILRGAGVKGVGQSSWGPAIFAIAAAGQVTETRDWLIGKKGLAREEIITTGACNHGARAVLTP
jgi:beta-ribofuranosylaminobenzene 5'-phosphate synthase